MLNEQGIEFEYREYTKQPLNRTELEGLFSKLSMNPTDCLRTRDAKKLGLTGAESNDDLLALMVDHPRLLQRPIGILGDQAVIGRPPENLLALVE